MYSSFLAMAMAERRTVQRRPQVSEKSECIHHFWPWPRLSDQFKEVAVKLQSANVA